ncbi:hypothetical protein [Nocardia brasiliensis]|uniref:hypothetical protein n=1 Tax=Nocardia brasiliensis TaxID=37326 RepID=UPI003D8B6CA3
MVALDALTDWQISVIIDIRSSSTFADVVGATTAFVNPGPNLTRIFRANRDTAWRSVALTA